MYYWRLNEQLAGALTEAMVVVMMTKARCDVTTGVVDSAASL